MGTPRGFGVLAMSTRSDRRRRDVRPRPWLRRGEASVSRDRGPVPREPRRAAHRSARRSARPICHSRGRARSLSRMAGWLMTDATVQAATTGQDQTFHLARARHRGGKSAQFELQVCAHSLQVTRFKAVRRHSVDRRAQLVRPLLISEVRAIASLSVQRVRRQALATYAGLPRGRFRCNSTDPRMESRNEESASFVSFVRRPVRT